MKSDNSSINIKTICALPPLVNTAYEYYFYKFAAETIVN